MKKIKFPTAAHQKAAESIVAFFSELSVTDSVLLVNSCARGDAIPESDLDFAILLSEGTGHEIIEETEKIWNEYSKSDPSLVSFKSFSRFSHIHLELISGIYLPVKAEPGEPIDYFEVEIGNQIAYSYP